MECMNIDKLIDFLLLYNPFAKFYRDNNTLIFPNNLLDVFMKYCINDRCVCLDATVTIDLIKLDISNIISKDDIKRIEMETEHE
jgi:hypothetical protein